MPEATQGRPAGETLSRRELMKARRAEQRRRFMVGLNPDERKILVEMVPQDRLPHYFSRPYSSGAWLDPGPHAFYAGQMQDVARIFETDPGRTFDSLYKLATVAKTGEEAVNALRLLGAEVELLEKGLLPGVTIEALGSFDNLGSSKPDVSTSARELSEAFWEPLQHGSTGLGSMLFRIDIDNKIYNIAAKQEKLHYVAEASFYLLTLPYINVKQKLNMIDAVTTARRLGQYFSRSNWEGLPGSSYWVNVDGSWAGLPIPQAQEKTEASGAHGTKQEASSHGAQQRSHTEQRATAADYGEAERLRRENERKDAEINRLQNEIASLSSGRDPVTEFLLNNGITEQKLAGMPKAEQTKWIVKLRRSATQAYHPNGGLQANENLYRGILDTLNRYDPNRRENGRR